MPKDKQQDKISIAKVLALLTVILIGMTFVTDWLITSSENQEFRDRYKEIEPGMSESIVISLLGAPNDRSSEFPLGQREGFERAAESEATHYLIWHRGTDVVYTIGFNEEGNVAIAEADGT
jgi:hypothetical protein